VAAALKEGLARPDELIDCQNGSITVGGHVFRDHGRYGLISFKKILAVSSNVGAAKLGIRLGQERLYDYIRAFGFGSPTGIGTPAIPCQAIVKESLQYEITAYLLQLQADTAYLPVMGLKVSKFFTIPHLTASRPAQVSGDVSY